MYNTVHRRNPTRRWLAIGLLISVQTLAASGVDDPIVATIEGRPVNLSDVDESGGQPIYEKAHALYQARVQALYALLSEQLMDREAEARGLSADELRQTEIIDKVAVIADAEIDRFLAQQPNLDATDLRVRRRVSLFLRMQAQSDRKTHFMQTLFDQYDVSVALSGPPAPPAEDIVGDIAPALGSPTAPVKIVSFSDYQCPYCRQMSTTLFQLHERFPDAVQIVYRHYPLHSDAQALAEAALCAGEQDRFWDYHAALFATPTVYASHTQRIAGQLGLKRNEFDACLAEHRHRSRVVADIQEGQRLQITGTPTNFINGIRIRGAAKLDTLIARVEELLTAERLAAVTSGQRPVGPGN